MVQIKMRKGEIGVLHTKADVEFDGCTAMEIVATMVELERLLIDIIKDIEEKTRINLHETFLENLEEGFEE